MAAGAVVILCAAALGATSGVDVFGHALAARIPAGEPVLVILATPKSKGGAMTREGPEMFFRLRDVPYHTLVRVDLRGLPRLFHGFARGKLRSAWQDSVRSYERVFHDHGVEPPPRVDRRLSFQADPDGRLAARAGVAEGSPGFLAVVLDGSGREIARGALPRDLKRLEAALRAAGGEKTPAP